MLAVCGLLLPLAGCLSDWEPCTSLSADLVAEPMGPSGLEWNYNESRLPAAFRLLYRVTNEGSRDVELSVATGGAAGKPIWPNPGGADIALKANETVLGIYQVHTGDRSGSGPFSIEFMVHARDRGCTVTKWARTIHVDVGRPGEKARPGVGALVHTAGFWENGTLFYTNMDRFHNDTTIPRGGWYEFTNGDPLRVYLYNRSRDERPPRYNASNNGVKPPGGQPSHVWSPTIEGFNAALKTMQTTGSWIVRIPPHQAYTQPGRERHPLYGDALVFYMEIRNVVVVPCPVPEPACDPTVPKVPPTRSDLAAQPEPLIAQAP